MQLAVWSIISSVALGILLFLANKLWEPIAEQFGCPVGITRRVKDLCDAVDSLCQIRDDFRRLHLYPYSSRHKGWLERLQDLKIQAETIKNDHITYNKNFFKRFYVGKQADIYLKKAIDLTSDGKGFLQEASSKPHLVCDVLPQLPQQGLLGMESYKKTALDFIKCREGTRDQVLAIWGMGGVGKTALLKLLRDSRHEFDHFDHVLFVQAGRGCTVDKMRSAIAISMGLPLPSMEQKTVIYNHLVDKSFLLLIDDLWLLPDLVAVGIPMPLRPALVSPHGAVVRQCQRKVVFTTRNLSVCGPWGQSKNVIQLHCLSQLDAWKLFSHNLGKDIANDSPVYQFAKEIVDSCGGLPLALCNVGRAMATKEENKEWIWAANILKGTKLHDLTGMGENSDILECLSLSFDSLPSYMKDCFLLCSLWPEFENISREKLVEWWIGMKLLDEYGPLAIEKGHFIICSLVSASLLEKGDADLCTTENSHVKMHKMVRKMALWIVNDHGDREKWLPHSLSRTNVSAQQWRIVQKAWISQFDSSRWQTLDCCPQLSLLVTRHVSSLEAMHFFREITFLDLRGIRAADFPLVICSLIKLEYLNLSATAIKALPLRLQNLSKLKYLYIRDAGNLQIIPEGLILQLKQLEVLDLFCSGGTSSKIQYSASLLEELARKSIDTVLGINVQNKQDVIRLGELRVCTRALCLDHFEDENHPEKIDLGLISNLSMLRELAIVKSSLCRELVVEGDFDHDKCGLLSGVEFFELSCLPNLQKIRWMNAGLRIRVISIFNCRIIRHATWVQHLSSLEELTIAYCSEIEEIICNAELQLGSVPNQMTTGFHRLRKLYLEQLPKLSHISEHGLPFEQLSYVRVLHCDKLGLIRIQERINHVKIKIDCNESWWSGLEHYQGVDRYFAPTFCY